MASVLAVLALGVWSLLRASEEKPGQGFPPSERLETPMLASGESHTLTFNAIQDSMYECHPHPWMKGRLIVQPRTSGAPRTWNVTIHESPGAWGFEPKELRIQAGDLVTWTNAGNEPHSVLAADGHGHVH